MTHAPPSATNDAHPLTNPLRPATSATPSGEVGVPFGRYRLFDKIGSGATADIYRAVALGGGQVDHRMQGAHGQVGEQDFDPVYPAGLAQMGGRHLGKEIRGRGTQQRADWSRSVGHSVIPSAGQQ